MARGRDSQEVDWYSPDPRAIIPLEEEGFKLRRSLAKALRQGRFEMRYNSAFDQVIRGCAKPRTEADAGETWISPDIIAAYEELHALGLAHSIEAWADNQLVGGLYGVSLGAAFFGESMFSCEPYASQACLVGLVKRLRLQGFTLLDVQFVNPHLEQFGVIEIPRDHYLKRLDVALEQDVEF